MADKVNALRSLRDRVSYQSITNRPALRLPNGAKVAVWTIVNIENWSPDGAMPRTVLPPPMGHPLLPDVANWAWHEYGMRVGFWRFLDALTSRGLRARSEERRVGKEWVRTVRYG